MDNSYVNARLAPFRYCTCILRKREHAGVTTIQNSNVYVRGLLHCDTCLVYFDPCNMVVCEKCKSTKYCTMNCLENCTKEHEEICNILNDQ